MKKHIQSLENKISNKDEELISFLPYLIAFPLEKTLFEEHYWTKINLLKDTLLNYLKFLGLLTASEFFNSPYKDKNIIASFTRIFPILLLVLGMLLLEKLCSF